MSIKDNNDYIRVLLYSYSTTMTGLGGVNLGSRVFVAKTAVNNAGVSIVRPAKNGPLHERNLAPLLQPKILGPTLPYVHHEGSTGATQVY